MANTTYIVPCKCKHEYQDEKYGKGMRVANATLKKNGSKITVRCTVCAATYETTEK